MKARLQNPRDGTQSSPVGSLSPPYSNPSHSPDPATYDEANLPGSPASLVESLASPGMLDKSRLALCMVMFTVVLFNPLAPLVSDSEGLYVTEGSSGRTILERKEEMMNMTTFLKVSTSSLLLSMLNVLFILAGKAPQSQSQYEVPSCVLAGLVRIFVYGEPRLEKVSGWSQYWRYRKQAEKDIETGRASQARQNLRAALVALGRPPPLTWLDCLSSLFWQLLVTVLDKLKLPKLVRSLMAADKKYNSL